MKETKIYLAGSMFDGVSELKTLVDFQDYLRGYLLKNGLASPAPTVFLEKGRFDRAGLFLESGYDVVPADNEPFQIALAALDDAGRVEAPGEFIFGFTGEIPARFLDKLQGRVKRTLLTIGGDSTSPFADAYLDVGTVLTGRAKEESAAAPEKPSVIVPLPPREPAPPRRPESKTPSPAEQTPAKSTDVPTAPVFRHTDTDNLVTVEGTENVILDVDVRESLAQLADSFDAPEGKIPLSELAASVRSRIPGMGKASDPFVQSLLPEDYRCIEEAGHLTVQRTERPELDPVPAKVGTWLLENDRMLNTDLTEIVSEQNSAAPLTEIANKIKTRYPGLENVVNEKWLESHLPHGISSFNSQNGPITIRVEVQPRQKTFNQHPDFIKVSKRAELMKDFCRWQGGEKRKKAAPSELERRKIDFSKRARELMVNLDAFPTDTHDDDLLLYADCYEALEISARILASAIDGKLPKNVELAPIGQNCADAICMLKTALLRRGVDLYVDGVQRDAYDELSKFTKLFHVFLQNMRFEDRMYMEERKGFCDELLALEKKLKPQNLAKKHDSLTKTVNYHLKKIRESMPGNVYDWNKVIAGINELIEECGVSPKSDEIRDFLRPFAGEVPEDADRTGPFLEVVQDVELETDPYWNQFFGVDAEGRTEEKGDADNALSFLQIPSEKKISNAVRKVRKAFKGAKMVFIGGQPTRHIIERYKRAFQVEDVIWGETSHGDSFERFLPLMKNPEVKLIVAYIPWCSHMHSTGDFAELARKEGKVFVRAPRGTNPDHMAATICQQAGLNNPDAPL